MPFDSAPEKTVVRNRRLELLGEALRRPLPSEFAWDFGCIDNCAVGLAEHLRIIPKTDSVQAEQLAHAFSLPVDVVVDLFFRLERDNSHPTPALIAQRIEAYLHLELDAPM